MKTCRNCGETKPPSDFIKRASFSDGLDSYCRACHKAMRAAYRKAHPERMKAYRKSYLPKRKTTERKLYRKDAERLRLARAERQRQQRRANPGSAYVYSKKYNAQRPERIQAQRAVRSAVKSGKLLPVTESSCMRCGKPAVHYHHWKGYSKANRLDVVPVCRLCHKKLHEPEGRA